MQFAWQACLMDVDLGIGSIIYSAIANTQPIRRNAQQTAKEC